MDVKTLSGPPEWRIADFRARSGHFFIFVGYAVDADPNTPPEVYVVASVQLQGFLADRRGDTISLKELDDEVHAREAWDRLAVPNAA